MFGYKDLKAAFINSHCTCNYLNSSNNKKTRVDQYLVDQIFHLHPNLLKKYKTKKLYTIYMCRYLHTHYALALFCSPKE